MGIFKELANAVKKITETASPSDRDAHLIYESDTVDAAEQSYIGIELLDRYLTVYIISKHSKAMYAIQTYELKEGITKESLSFNTLIKNTVVSIHILPKDYECIKVITDKYFCNIIKHRSVKTIHLNIGTDLISLDGQ